MKNMALGIAVLALVAGGIAGFVWNQNRAPEARRVQLAQEFLTCLPDSLESYHHEEIMTLFENLWFKYDHGLVTEEDLDMLTEKMRGYVDTGTISGTDLIYYMAEVGYTTYKGEEKYRLPSGEVDHPVLNPDAAMVDLLPDTAGFSDWLVDKRTQEREAAEREEAERKNGDSEQE